MNGVKCKKQVKKQQFWKGETVHWKYLEVLAVLGNSCETVVLLPCRSAYWPLPLLYWYISEQVLYYKPSTVKHPVISPANAGYIVPISLGKPISLEKE